MSAEPSLADLIEIMARLRTPGSGCPWDLAQTASSIAPYAIEEAYEVVDAIERGSASDLREELGDLLLQVVFHARLAEEVGSFRFDDVVATLCAKLVRRHPHVFAAVPVDGVEAVKRSWEAIKADERRIKAGEGGDAAPFSVLADVPIGLPALTRALKLQQKASRVGFDWNDTRAVIAKIREETDEIEEALESGSREATADEIGDLLFAAVNLARHAAVDPEAAVRGTNRKFERRFAYIEAALARRGASAADADLATMDALWDEAKGQGL